MHLLAGLSVITVKAVKFNKQGAICEVHARAVLHPQKIRVKRGIPGWVKVKVQNVRTMVVPGKMRRRGKYSGYRPDWKKAYVTLREGEKMIEYGENV